MSARRRGQHVAAVATARKLAVIIWHLLRKGESYAWARPALHAKKLRDLELKAGYKAERGQRGAAHAYNAKSHRDQERRWVEQAETAYARDEEVELALRGLHFGDVEVEEANRIGLELALGGSLALDLRQPRDSMTLQATVKGRARQMRNGRLQSVEIIVERQQSMPSKGDDHGLLFNGQV